MSEISLLTPITSTDRSPNRAMLYGMALCSFAALLLELALTRLLLLALSRLLPGGLGERYRFSGSESLGLDSADAVQFFPGRLFAVCRRVARDRGAWKNRERNDRGAWCFWTG